MKETGRKTTGIFVAYFLIYIVWGSTYYYVGVALEGFPPFLLGAFRFTAAGMILLGWCCLRGESVFKNKLIGKSAVSGIVLLFIDMAVVMSAQQYLSSSLVAVIASSTAIWIMSLDMPMWKKNFRSPATVTGIIIGFLGVIMLYVEQLNAENKANVHTEYGVLILVFGSVSWALGTLYAKYRSSGEENVNAFAGSAWQMLFAGAMFWICSSVNGDVNNTDFAEIPDSSWLSLAYLIVFGSILTYSAYIWLLKIRPAAEVGTHAYVNPLVAVCIGTTLGKETVTFVQLAGLAVILLSVMLINKRIK
ncbi:MAG: EamA family transporter [Prevotellaceae bacterium]|nr:EamA family transporter [Prevotellaceae bacterium]